MSFCHHAPKICDEIALLPRCQLIAGHEPYPSGRASAGGLDHPADILRTREADNAGRGIATSDCSRHQRIWRILGQIVGAFGGDLDLSERRRRASVCPQPNVTSKMFSTISIRAENIQHAPLKISARHKSCSAAPLLDEQRQKTP
jgi:hypothetical protein